MACLMASLYFSGSLNFYLKTKKLSLVDLALMPYSPYAKVSRAPLLSFRYKRWAISTGNVVCFRYDFVSFVITPPL